MQIFFEAYATYIIFYNHDDNLYSLLWTRKNFSSYYPSTYKKILRSPSFFLFYSSDSAVAVKKNHILKIWKFLETKPSKKRGSNACNLPRSRLGVPWYQTSQQIYV